jgi:beta-glucanase (GH16 family)
MSAVDEEIRADIDDRVASPVLTRGSRLATVAPWLLGVVSLCAVAFGLYSWGRPPTQAAAPAHAGLVMTVTGPGKPEAMPVGDIPGWRQVFADNFNGRTLDRAKWTVYDGPAGGDPAGWFEPSHVSVSSGMLVISAYRDPSRGDRWATGGVSSLPGLAQTYGKYLVRFRLDPGEGVSHALLLAAANGSWPPEIDFSEDNGSGRNTTLATLHYTSADKKIFRTIPVDLTQWHTLGVEWTPGRLDFTLDGRTWLKVAGSEVPAVPMVLDMQTQTWPCVGTYGRCPDSTTPKVVRMYVDWIVAYAPASQIGARPSAN